MIVNGGGAGSTTDIPMQFSYYVENNTAPVSINGLHVEGNVTRQFTDQGRNLSLNSVNLNPFTWSVYVSQSNGFPVTVSNSKINEIAALTNGLVNLSNSTLQLAETGALGPGSKMNITWSQGILAQYGGKVSITYSGIHGNNILVAGAGSSIGMSNVLEYRNGSPTMSCAPAPEPDIHRIRMACPYAIRKTHWGQCSQVSTQGSGVVTGTPACNP